MVIFLICLYIVKNDHSIRRIGNSINNLSLISKIGFNLTWLDNSMGDNLTLKKNSKIYKWFQNIETLIFIVIPYISTYYIFF